MKMTMFLSIVSHNIIIEYWNLSTISTLNIQYLKKLLFPSFEETLYLKMFAISKSYSTVETFFA